MAYESVKNQIDAYIKANGVNLITGPVLNAVLTTMLDELGEGYAFQGALNTTDTPSPAADIPQAWLASAGTYLGGSITVDEDELALIIHTADGWSKETVYRGIQLSYDAIVEALGYTPADEANLAEKQDTIADLTAIRSGAALGSTSVQPADIENMVEAEPIGSIIPPVNPSEFATKEELSQLQQGVALMGRDASQLLVDVYDAEQSALAGTDTDRQVINSSGVVTTISGTNYHVVTFDVSSLQGQSVKVTANTNWGSCLYAIYDGNNSLLSKSSVAPSSGSKYSIIDEEIALPFNAVTLYVAYNISWEQASVKYDKRVSKIEELEDIIDVIPTEDKYVEGVENVISGKYISPAGVISDGGGTYVISNNALVTPGQVIFITASSNWGNALYAFFASDNTVVQVGQLAAASGTVTEIKDSQVAVPNNAAYIVAARNLNSLNRISVKWKDGKQLAKRFSGKKWVVVGDSLTEENSTTTKHYFDYVAEDTGIETVNMGVGGTGYMRGKNTSQAFYQRISSIEMDADVVTIFGSFNDLNYPALGFNSMEEALGNYDDDTDATISGCINLTIKNLQSAIPLVRLGIVAPCPWSSTRPFQNHALMYVDRLKKIAEYHSIPFLDLWRGSNLRPWDADFRALAYTKDTGQDGNPVGTHPDETGHAILAPKFESFLGELLL